MRLQKLPIVPRVVQLRLPSPTLPVWNSLPIFDRTGLEPVTHLLVQSVFSLTPSANIISVFIHLTIIYMVTDMKIIIYFIKVWFLNGRRGGTRTHTGMILSHLSAANWITRPYFERDWYHLTLSSERRTCWCNHFVVSQLITFLLYHTWLCLSRGFFIFLIHYAPYSKNWKIRQYHSGAQQIVTGGFMSTTFIL